MSGCFPLSWCGPHSSLWSLLKLPGHLARAYKKSPPQIHVEWPDSGKQRNILRKGTWVWSVWWWGTGGLGWAASFLHCLVGRPFLTISQKTHGGCFWDIDDVFISGSASGPYCQSLQLPQIFPPLTSQRPDALGFIGTKEEDKGADTPPHRFRSENWLAHPAARVAQVG